MVMVFLNLPYNKIIFLRGSVWIFTRRVGKSRGVRFYNFYFYVVFPILFFTGLPNLSEPDENRETSKFLSNTLHYLFIPVLLACILFVYAYMVKIRAQLYTGNAETSIMGSLAVLGTVLICNILYPAHQKKNLVDIDQPDYHHRLLYILPCQRFHLERDKPRPSLPRQAKHDDHVGRK